MTSSTESLRHMLDERGVEYDRAATINGGTVATFWYDRDGNSCSAIEGADDIPDDIPDGKVCVQAYVTPEQAISATLGAGECTLESVHAYCDPYVRTAYQIELSCHTIDAWGDPVPPSYCPYCGKRVVKEDA